MHHGLEQAICVIVRLLADLLPDSKMCVGIVFLLLCYFIYMMTGVCVRFLSLSFLMPRLSCSGILSQE